MNELSRDARDTHGSPIMLLKATYCNVISIVANVMLFAEECLAVFWIYAHVLFCVYFWL